MTTASVTCKQPTARQTARRWHRITPICKSKCRGRSSHRLPPPVHENGQLPKLVLIIDMHTGRARSYKVLQETPCRAVIPQEPEAYGRFIRGAQAAGYTVVIQAGEA